MHVAGFPGGAGCRADLGRLDERLGRERAAGCDQPEAGGTVAVDDSADHDRDVEQAVLLLERVDVTDMSPTLVSSPSGTGSARASCVDNWNQEHGAGEHDRQTTAEGQQEERPGLHLPIRLTVLRWVDSLSIGAPSTPRDTNPNLNDPETDGRLHSVRR